VSFTDILLSGNEDDIPDWNELSISGKLKLFDPWNVALIISSIFIFIGSLWVSVGGIEVYRTGEYIIGFGAFLAWISLPKSYENVKCYNIINNTIINSASILTKAVIGIGPLIVGFGLFGLCIFLHSPRFGSLTFSFNSMNALQYTESVYDIFYNIFKLDWLLSQIYTYAFLFLVIIIIQNVFLIIIGDGYVKSKYFHKNNWIKAGDKIVFKEGEEDDPLE